MSRAKEGPFSSSGASFIARSLISTGNGINLNELLIHCAQRIRYAETRVTQDQFATTRCSLDTAQEETQMTKLSLSEKETELLQAQDQLL